ncbi:MAG: hypothetical protein J0I06_23875 [Planctomycetes bacterium]|nr:hypothetical protein [Planctomycetota bacterium]
MRRPVFALVAAFLAVASAVAVTTQTSNTATVPAQANGPSGTVTAPATELAPTETASEQLPAAARPEPLDGNAYWINRNIENEIALFVGVPCDVLFLGDSVTDFLAIGTGQPLWDAFYAPLGALDFAVAGATTSHVLWQVETGQVAMAAPKVVVLLIGSNNLGNGQKPKEVAAGVEKIVKGIGAQLPDTRVLLLGILPRGFAADDPFRNVIAETNRLLADLEGDQVTYLDIGHWFVSTDGSISPAVLFDGAHPTLFGYEIYSIAIWETLIDLLPQP